MNSTLYTAVLAGLALVLVAMFAFGCYWLATKDRPASPQTPARSSPSSTVTDEHDEWEAQAPYPDRALDALHNAASVSSSHATSRQSSSAPPEFDDSLFEPASPAPEARHAPSASDYFSYAPQPTKEAASCPADAHVCPQCGSTRIETLNVGRKIGSVAGATSGFAMALSGAEAGPAVGAIGGPVGAVFGGLAGAVVAGLLGSAAGSVAGSAVGGVLDDNVFNNYRCLTCGHGFGSTLH
ncbi:hypothetical protein [Burkholderia metallica]|uniref:hypothetical protein n=1 Tax=Burkholderia metallica TaxID=488729 RepID=UPI001F5BF86F|nr:hypothetical protein [Burkholderia metallica]